MDQPNEADRAVRPHRKLAGLRRSAAQSLWRTAQETGGTAVARRRRRGRGPLLTSAIWFWVSNYLAHLFAQRRPFKVYAPGHGGVYPLPEQSTVALAGDWGTGTPSAYAVGDAIRSARPTITIHLGDVYYSGTTEEYQTFFLPEKCWPRGTHPQGTFVLNANHDMYSGGEGYFDAALGQYAQETSYFCLENAYWRIVALDTGYHVTRLPVPISILGFLDRTRLDDANIRWLREKVFADPQDRRPVILLSHHQWFSAFDTAYPAIGEPLLPFLDRVHLWFWGHEHRFAGYAPYAPSGHTIRARCIGHGGMPIELDPVVKRSEYPLVFYDNRRAGRVGGQSVGYCGFALLQFDNAHLRISYHDQHNTELFVEHWEQTPSGLHGAIEHGTLPAQFVRLRDLEALVAP